MTPEYILVENRFQFRKRGSGGSVKSDLHGSAAIRVTELLGGCGEDGEVGAKGAEFCGAGDSKRHALLVVADPQA